MFEQSERGYWNSLQNSRKFLDWLAEQLNITTPHQWYSVSSSDALKGQCEKCESVRSVKSVKGVKSGKSGKSVKSVKSVKLVKSLERV